MRQDRAAVLVFAALITALTFWFPGHTWLQSDTQIYAPLLEHIQNPDVLARDAVVQRSHLAFTLYDEITLALSAATRASLHAALLAQQIVMRFLGVLGLYLIASAIPLPRKLALFVAAVASLGALVAGPSVLTVEYEPVPRAFALPLVILAVGLHARDHDMLASIAGSLAVLYHPPTAALFWILFCAYLVAQRRYRALIPLGIAAIVLIAASRLQAGAVEQQSLPWRIPPDIEQILRLRAPYNWVSTWGAGVIGQYVVYWGVGMLAFLRLQPKRARLFLIGLPAMGLASIPVSWLLLDVLKWGVAPQLQPARAVLFVLLFMIVLSAAAGIRAALAGKTWEAVLWFFVVFRPVMPDALVTGRRMLLLVALAVASAAVAWTQRWHKAMPLLLAMGVAPFFVIPLIGQIQNYPNLRTPALAELTAFGRTTPADSVFLFPDAERALWPGIFRAEAERALYVDWKSGGQANFYGSYAKEWWRRWQQTMAAGWPADPMQACVPGVDYVVVRSGVSLPGKAWQIHPCVTR